MVFPEPGTLVGEIQAFELGSRSSTTESFKVRTVAERIHRQLTALPGKEEIAERQMERLASMTIDLTHALTSEQLGQNDSRFDGESIRS